MLFDNWLISADVGHTTLADFKRCVESKFCPTLCPYDDRISANVHYMTLAEFKGCSTLIFVNVAE